MKNQKRKSNLWDYLKSKEFIDFRKNLNIEEEALCLNLYAGEWLNNCSYDFNELKEWQSKILTGNLDYVRAFNKYLTNKDNKEIQIYKNVFEHLLKVIEIENSKHLEEWHLQEEDIGFIGNILTKFTNMRIDLKQKTIARKIFFKKFKEVFSDRPYMLYTVEYNNIYHTLDSGLNKKERQIISELESWKIFNYSKHKKAFAILIYRNKFDEYFKWLFQNINVEKHSEDLKKNFEMLFDKFNSAMKAKKSRRNKR